MKEKAESNSVFRLPFAMLFEVFAVRSSHFEHIFADIVHFLHSNDRLRILAHYFPQLFLK